MKYGIFGNYGHSNIGDEAILRGLLSLLSDQEVVVYTDSISDSTFMHNMTLKESHLISFRILKPVFNGRYYLLPMIFIYILKNVMKSDVVLVGGGGLFNDINKSAFIQYILILLFAKIMFKKTYLVGISVGPLKSRLLKSVLFFTGLCVDKIYVRDKDSLGYFSASNSFLIPDLSLGLGLDLLPTGVQSFRIAVSLMDVTKSQGAEVNEIYLKKVEGFLTQLDKIIDGLEVDLVAMDFRRDSEVITKVHKSMVKKSVSCNVVYPNQFSKLDHVFKRSNFILATRLHSAVLAILYEKPFMVISYQEKVKNYFYSHGLSEVVLGINEFEECDLLAKFKNILSSSELPEVISNLKNNSRNKLVDLFENFK